MSSKLKEVVLHVKTAADTLAVSSREVSETSEHLSQGTTEQATAAEEASAAMEQMAANIRQNADNAVQTERIALQSTDYAEESGKVVAEAVKLGIPAPALSGSLAYYDAYRSDRLPANLIQAQRDYFGAHTYARTDMEGVFHADWAAAVAASKQK